MKLILVGCNFDFWDLIIFKLIFVMTQSSTNLTLIIINIISTLKWRYAGPLPSGEGLDIFDSK